MKAALAEPNNGLSRTDPREVVGLTATVKNKKIKK